MSWFRRIAEGFREFEQDFNTAFGLTPLHDVDVPHDPAPAIDREELAKLRDEMARLGDACYEVAMHIDAMDPTPLGLAEAASVTDLNARRP